LHCSWFVCCPIIYYLLPKYNKNRHVFRNYDKTMSLLLLIYFDSNFKTKNITMRLLFHS
jgi:hypothetical protein